MAGGRVGGGRNGVVETKNILSVFVKLIKNIFKLYISQLHVLSDILSSTYIE